MPIDQEIPQDNLNPDSPAAIEIHAVGLTTRKRHGEAAEAAFLAKASGFGFGIAKPWGDSERYDFILDSGHGFLRVQVKSTQRFAEKRYRVKNAGWKATYTRDEIDFIVVYIIPEDLWYVVPIEAAANRQGLRFYPQGGRHGKLEKYREAWCLLACPPSERQRRNHLPKSCRCPELTTRCALCPLVPAGPPRTT